MKILILGAGIWQVPYIKKAREIGLTVYVTDWSAEAYGKDYANVFEPIDVRDIESTYRFAKNNEIEAIFTNSDVGVLTAAEVAERLGLSFHTVEQARIATNKYLMRKAIKEAGLKTPLYAYCESKEQMLENVKDFSYPVIIKPVDNCGSRGVYTICNETELIEAADDTFKNSFSGSALIEELMIGNESSVEVIVKDEVSYIMGWCRKTKSDYPYRFDIQLDYYPDQIDEEDTQVKEMVNGLIEGIQIKNGILHIEFMWTTEGVKIIEFALRGCGSDVTTHLLPFTRGFDLPKFLIEQACNMNPKIEFTANKYGTLKFIVPSPGIIDSIEGLEYIASLPYVTDFHCDINKGMKINRIKSGNNRPGHYIVIGNSREDITEKLNHISSSIKINYK